MAGRLPVDVETTLRWIASVKKEDYWTNEWAKTIRPSQQPDPQPTYSKTAVRASQGRQMFGPAFAKTPYLETAKPTPSQRAGEPQRRAPSPDAASPEVMCALPATRSKTGSPQKPSKSRAKPSYSPWLGSVPILMTRPEPRKGVSEFSRAMLAQAEMPCVLTTSPSPPRAGQTLSTRAWSTHTHSSVWERLCDPYALEAFEPPPPLGRPPNHVRWPVEPSALPILAEGPIGTAMPASDCTRDRQRPNRNVRAETAAQRCSHQQPNLPHVKRGKLTGADRSDDRASSATTASPHEAKRYSRGADTVEYPVGSAAGRAYQAVLNTWVATQAWRFPTGAPRAV